MNGNNSIENDKVYILGAFDDSISNNVIPKFVELIEKKRHIKNASIEIFINSRGGLVRELYSLLSLIEIAKSNDIKIITYNLGTAASCASMLFVHGDIRKMYKYATNIMHLGECSDTFTTIEQLKRGYGRMNRHFANIIDMYAKHTKMKKKEIEAHLKDDKFTLSADECLKYGICDEVI